MNYNQILPQLFVGSFPQTPDDLDRLASECGITAVLSLQTDEDQCALNLDWDSLAATYSGCGLAFRRAPVRDGDTAELRAKLPACVRILEDLLKAGHTVYLHCTAGVNRSPTVAIAYLCWCRGWNLEEAVVHVEKCRDCVPDLDALREAVWDEEGGEPPPA